MKKQLNNLIVKIVIDFYLIDMLREYVPIVEVKEQEEIIVNHAEDI